MAIIALKAWYLEQYEPLSELERRPHDLRLSRNSLLKSGLRADFLDDAATLRQAPWFQRYLGGEVVEFYIEGSGTYTISNLDLLSHEIYFTKQDSLAQLEPMIFFSGQTDYPESGITIRTALEGAIAQLNTRSRLPLTLEQAHRPSTEPIRRHSPLMRKLRQSLVFVADGTAIAHLPGPPLLAIPSPQVCVELGYALQCKHPEQLLLVQQNRDTIPSHFPFELPAAQALRFDTTTDLEPQLLTLLTLHLQRYGLLS